MSYVVAILDIVSSEQITAFSRLKSLDRFKASCDQTLPNAFVLRLGDTVYPVGI